MEIKGTFVFDASPALLAAINKIADVLTPVARTTPGYTASQQNVTEITTTVAPTPEPVTESPAIQEESPTAYTLLQVRSIMAEKQESKPADEKKAVTLKMKEILNALGAKNISDLAEDKYSEFVQKISAL